MKGIGKNESGTDYFRRLPQSSAPHPVSNAGTHGIPRLDTAQRRRLRRLSVWLGWREHFRLRNAPAYVYDGLGKKWKAGEHAEGGLKLNNKTLRQLRRTLRREATYFVKFRKEIIDGWLEDHCRTGGGELAREGITP